MIVWAVVWPGQRRVQVELEQLTEQGPVQVTWQLAPSPHETLPLLPTVTTQLDFSQLMLPLSPVVARQVLLPLQSMLQEPAQTPLQSFPLRHLREQLPPEALHPVLGVPIQSQLAPAAQAQSEPVQTHPGPGQAVGVEPQPPNSSISDNIEVTRMARWVRMILRFPG